MGELAIPSLTIENFRCFPKLHLERLGRVNLITGRNSVGKSYLLEALELYRSRGGLSSVLQQLQARGDLQAVDASSGSDDHFLRRQVEGIAAVFHGWPMRTAGMTASIGSAPGVLRLAITEEELSQTVEEDGNPLYEDESALVAYLRSWWDGQPVQHAKLLRMASADLLYRRSLSAALTGATAEPWRYRYWRQGVHEPATLAALWDDVALLPAGQDVLRAMQLVCPELEGLQFRRGNGTSAYQPEAKLRGSARLVPLQSLGDGIGRLLALVLGLVTTEGGLLLVDEIDTGLHYSVERELWSMVFRLARECRVQVFATTHSWDCIKAFQAAAADDATDDGLLIRLQKRDDRYHPTIFDKDDLAVVTEHEIEVR